MSHDILHIETRGGDIWAVVVAGVRASTELAVVACSTGTAGSLLEACSGLPSGAVVLLASSADVTALSSLPVNTVDGEGPEDKPFRAGSDVGVEAGDGTGEGTGAGVGGRTTASSGA